MSSPMMTPHSPMIPPLGPNQRSDSLDDITWWSWGSLPHNSDDLKMGQTKLSLPVFADNASSEDVSPLERILAEEEAEFERQINAHEDQLNEQVISKAFRKKRNLVKNDAT